MADVSVLIPSIGRECLKKCLHSVIASAQAGGVEAEIIVADDSTDGAAAARVSEAGLSDRVRVLTVGARNISAGRNACLEAAQAPFAAFVDDDEWVEEAWLANLLAAARDFEADAVFGWVIAEYPPGTATWFVAADPFSRRRGARGEALDYSGAGNSLIRMATVARMGLAFDLDFGRTGGEDTDFFTRMRRAGGRLVATDDAAVYEEVPADRARLRYVVERALISGQGHAIIQERGWSALKRAGFYADAALKTVFGAVAGGAAWLTRRELAVPLFIRAARNMGKLRAALGMRMFQPYSRPVPPASGTPPSA